MRSVRPAVATWGAWLALLIAHCTFPTATAQEGWNPFRPNVQQPKDRLPRAGDQVPIPAEPMARGKPSEPIAPQAPWTSPRAGSVEKGELAPILAPDASGLPLELWRGLDLKKIEALLAGLDLPPRSPALHRLWRRVLLSSATPPAGAPNEEHFVALRLEALYRSGLLSDMEAVLDGSNAPGPILQALRARRDIGIGRRDVGCRTIAALATPGSGLPGRLKGETQLLAGYCAAAANDAHAAGLAADLAREEGLDAELPLAVLTAFATGSKPNLALPKRVLLLDYRFLELLGPINALQVFDKAEPALLAMLAGDTGADARLQIAAAEAALRLNALQPEAAAEVYRRQPMSGAGSVDPAAQQVDPLLRRALFFQAADLARAPAQRARFLRAILDDARRSGSFLQTAGFVAPLLANVQPAPDLGWFADTAVETALAAGDFGGARQWAEAAGLWHWLALVDVADPERRGGRLPSLGALEDMAARGRLDVETLHKLATVLDALDIDVPIAIWDAASRTPQPAGGHLPETGILAELAAASKANDAGRTILLVLRAVGAHGPDRVNLLVLGDAIRALQRIGLAVDARRLGLEALLPAWPRTPRN